MRWGDALRLAFRNIARRPGRALLTIMAVALGSALLTGLLTIVGTARSRVLDHLTAGGPLASIRVALPRATAPPGDGEAAFRNRRAPSSTVGATARLDESAVTRIAQVPGVGSVLPVVSAPVMVIPPDPPTRSAGAARSSEPEEQPTAPVGPVETREAVLDAKPFPDTLVGVDLRRSGELPILLVAGRLPSPGSFTEVAVTERYLEQVGVARQEGRTVLGTELVLGAPRAFGEGSRSRLRGRWTRVEVVGVVAQDAQAGQLLAPIEHAQLARAWTASGGEASRFGVDASAYEVLLVVARGLDRVGEVRNQIEVLGYSTSAPESLIATILRYLGLVHLVLAGIGGLALAIAGLGIANALLAAVRERRREIGVLKAIGATNRDIRRLFLVEAGALGVIGGALGTLIGYGVALIVGSMVNTFLQNQGVPGVQVKLAQSVFLIGVAGSGLLAVVAGLVPARRAAQLPPWEAMSES
ncbi:MAG: ABC transporter permease [Acidimicrobiia bacterium]